MEPHSTWPWMLCMAAARGLHLASEPAAWQRHVREPDLVEGRKLLLGIFLEDLRENLILSPRILGPDPEPGLHLQYTHGPNPDWVPAGPGDQSKALRKLEQVRRAIVAMTEGNIGSMGMVHDLARTLATRLACWKPATLRPGPDELLAQYLASRVLDDRQIFGGARFLFRSALIDRAFGPRSRTSRFPRARPGPRPGRRNRRPP